VRRKQTIAPLDADDLHPWDAPPPGKKQLPPRLDTDEILRWADAWHKRHGKWPKMEDGPIPEAPVGTTWRKADNALRLGLRGLPGGSSLPRLLATHRGVRNVHGLPVLTEHVIEQWARLHHERHGGWPTEYSGPVEGEPGETWKNIDAALRGGHSRLPGGDTLPQLLGRRCGARTWSTMQQLTEATILAWADAERGRSGSWPTAETGPIPEAPGETWSSVENALRGGGRGLPGGSSLARLLARRRGVRNKAALPPLTHRQILSWADAWHQDKRDWPTANSGAIPGTGETWKAINIALHQGLRGLAGGDSLYALLRRHRKHRRRKPGRKGQHPPPTRGQLRSRADKLRDHGVPMAGVSKLTGLTIEAVEELLQSPRCQR
jgi:hypothetical protein